MGGISTATLPLSCRESSSARSVRVHDRAARLEWFKSVILPHEAALRRRLRRMAPAGVDVDDIASEALVRAYTTEAYARIDRGRGFLFTIARNLLTDLARRRAVVSFDLVADLDAMAVVDEAPSSEAVVSARDELRRLQKVVDGLPPQCRRVFLMRRIDELPLAEIAGRLALSVSTVEKHLSRAMALVSRGMAESEPVSGRTEGRAWRLKTKTR